jgi:hypothetical protein
MAVARVVFRAGLERRQGAPAAERCRRMPGCKVLAAKMTPEFSYGVSMTFLETFANFFCGGLFRSIFG